MKTEKEIREEVEALTILIAIAREEGNDEEHKRVVDRIMEIIKGEGK